MNPGNKLIIITHSPYIINYLTLAIKSEQLSRKIAEINKSELNGRLNDIVPLASLLKADDCVIYEIDNAGNIVELDTYQGLPSDDNKLNQKMAEGNELFANLLEIEDLCQ